MVVGKERVEGVPRLLSNDAPRQEHASRTPPRGRREGGTGHRGGGHAVRPFTLLLPLRHRLEYSPRHGMAPGEGNHRRGGRKGAVAWAGGTRRPLPPRDGCGCRPTTRRASRGRNRDPPLPSTPHPSSLTGRGVGRCSWGRDPRQSRCRPLRHGCAAAPAYMFARPP